MFFFSLFLVFFVLQFDIKLLIYLEGKFAKGVSLPYINNNTLDLVDYFVWRK